MDTLRPPSLPAPHTSSEHQSYLAKLEAQLQLAAPFARRSLTARRISLLFVEDDHFIRQTVMLMLNDPLYIIRFASNGEEAIRSYVSIAPHMVFLDIELPDVSGLELLDIIRRQDPYCHPIMLTGHTETDHVRYAVEHGARGYIAKPFNGQKLNDCVQRFMGKRIL